MNINRSWLKNTAKCAAMTKIGFLGRFGKWFSNLFTRRATQAGTNVGKAVGTTSHHVPSTVTNATSGATNAVTNTAKTTIHHAPSTVANAANEAANAAMHAAQTGAATGGGIVDKLKGAGKFLGGTALNVGAFMGMGYGLEWLINKLSGGQGGQAANQAQQLQQELAALINAANTANQQGAGIPPAVPGVINPYQLGATAMQMTPEQMAAAIAMNYQLQQLLEQYQRPRPTLHDQPFVTYG
jgi:hypothetical protein